MLAECKFWTSLAAKDTPLNHNKCLLYRSVISQSSGHYVSLTQWLSVKFSLFQSLGHYGSLAQ